MVNIFIKGIKPPYQIKDVTNEIEYLGVKSLNIVILTSLATGMVLALQSAYALARFGAKIYLGKIVSLSLVRELGPVLTALVVAGRVGAGIAAELGSMKVTDQIDALRALGSDPVKKLIVPKFIAMLIFLPLLTVLADFIGIIGGLVVSMFDLNLSGHFYIKTVIDTLSFNDIFSGLGKTIFFAFLISTISSYIGINTTGGTQGVGRATTYAVMFSSINILLWDFILTKIFLIF